jgi:seryl-tRNA synthetase
MAAEANDVPQLWWSDRQFLVGLWNRMIVLEEKVDGMTQAFDDLRAAQEALGGEGGQFTQAKDAILAAIAGLQSINATLQAANAELQAAATAANASLAAGEQVAADTTATITSVVDTANTVEQQLNDAAAALQPAPTP